MINIGGYIPPFTDGMSLVELGGGAQPRVRPNIDVRMIPGLVDLVADFNQPLPVHGDQFDGLLCIFALEHVSYRNVHGLVSEMCRILKPGGVAALVVPNTLEQCRKAVNTPVWDKDISSMLFGDQDYSDNTHKLAISPESAVRMFKECGFYRVETAPLPTCDTDMSITAYKSAAVIAIGRP